MLPYISSGALIEGLLYMTGMWAGGRLLHSSCHLWSIPYSIPMGLTRLDLRWKHTKINLCGRDILGKIVLQYWLLSSFRSLCGENVLKLWFNLSEVGSKFYPHASPSAHWSRATGWRRTSTNVGRKLGFGRPTPNCILENWRVDKTLHRSACRINLGINIRGYISLVLHYIAYYITTDDWF